MNGKFDSGDFASASGWEISCCLADDLSLIRTCIVERIDYSREPGSLMYMNLTPSIRQNILVRSHKYSNNVELGDCAGVLLLSRGQFYRLLASQELLVFVVLLLFKSLRSGSLSPSQLWRPSTLEGACRV